MQFEFDQNKSESNHEKHGIDFLEAQELWEGPHFVIGTVSVVGEKREVVVGRIFGEYWTAVTTRRGSAVRIISVRRASDKECSAYDKNYNS